MKYTKGFSLFTLGWGDGNSFVPINFALLASANEDNALGLHKAFDKRSTVGRRRKQAQSKASEVLFEFLKTAIYVATLPDIFCLTPGFLFRRLFAG